VVQVDDFKFTGVLFVPYGVAQLVIGFAGSSAIGAEGDLVPLLLICTGALTITAGIAAFRRLPWAKYILGVVAFLIASGFPIGTVLSAVAFIAIGRDWHRSHVSQSK